MSESATPLNEAVDRMEGVADVAHDAVDTAAACAVRCVRKIQERPLQSVVFAMLVGVVFGMCLRR